MSNRTYNEKLREAIVDLKEMAEFEKPPDEALLPKDLLQKRQYFAQFFKATLLRYLDILRNLEDTHDQTIQPQKREDIKELLEYVMVRILEVKENLRDLTGIYVDLDDILVDMKELPGFLEVTVPRFYRERQGHHGDLLNRRDALIRAFQERHNIQDQSTIDRDTLAEDNGIPMSLEQAVLLIQKNERARQGRQQARAMKQVREKEARMMLIENEGLKSKMDAAVTIQRIFKGFLARKKAARMSKEELEFLGMVPPDTSNHVQDVISRMLLPPAASAEGFSTSGGGGAGGPSVAGTATTSGAAGAATLADELLREDPVAKSLKIRERRKMLQRQNAVELQQRRHEMRTQVLADEGPAMVEDLKFAIMERLLLYQQVTETGGVPPFPSEKDGGSKVFMAQLGESEAAEAQAAAAAAAKEKEAKDDKKGGKDAKKGSSSGKKDEKKKGKKGEADEPKEEPALIDKDDTKLRIVQAIEKLINRWKDREYAQDFMQRFDPQMLREELMKGEKGIEEVVRKMADQMVRAELANLQMQLASDEKPGKKGKKDKKGKKKGKKGKKSADDDEDGEDSEAAEASKSEEKQRQCEAMLENFVSKEIVVTYPKNLSIKDYIGQHRLLGSLLPDWGTPSVGQVRQAIAEIILPLGSEEVHAHAPYTQGVLIYGPKSGGKSMVAQIIAAETSATLFDISLEKLTASYDNKDVPTIVSAVFEVAKYYQPSIILMEDVDQIFRGGKKKPKAPIPKLRKELETQVGKLTAGEHRVLIVGTSREPWEMEMPAVRKFFQKMIYTPLPDYGSMQELWKTTIRKRIEEFLANDPAQLKPYGDKPNIDAIVNKLDIQTLAYMSYTHGYTSGAVVKAIKRTLTEKRVRRLDQYSEAKLQEQDFTQQLVLIDPMYSQDGEKFEQFMAKLDIRNRKRTKKDEDEERALLAAQEEEKKGNKKKAPAKKK